MRTTVTGGAGFIGHHLVRRLVAEGHAVTVIDDFSTGDRARLEEVADRITVIEGSILDPRALDAATAGSDVVFHEAAIASVERSLRDPVRASEVNVEGTIEVMLAAARHRVRRVVLAASCAVYGSDSTPPCHEEQRADPQSPYAVSKLAAEGYLHALGAARHVDTVALRYFNVFGTDQDPAGEYAAVVPRFVTAVLQGSRPVIYGDGRTSRDFVHVDNVVEANLRAADHACSRLTCNIGCGEQRSLLDLLEAIGRAARVSPEPVFEPARVGDVRHSEADITRARRELGYRVIVPFEAGIARTVDAYRARQPRAMVAYG